jgi:hypothetical protein
MKSYLLSTFIFLLGTSFVAQNAQASWLGDYIDCRMGSSLGHDECVKRADRLNFTKSAVPGGSSNTGNAAGLAQAQRINAQLSQTKDSAARVKFLNDEKIQEGKQRVK